MTRVLLFLALCTPSLLKAQAPADAINIFLDCSYCDRTFVRTEINYVNWVRDRAVADLHVLVSNENTGGGGDRFTFAFIGLRRFLGQEDTLVYTSSNNDTEDEIRRAWTRTLAIGLVPFVARTKAGIAGLQVSWKRPESEVAAAPATKPDDRWNFWVFTLSLNSSFDGEESQNFLNWNAEIEANRTTEKFKTDVELNGSFAHSSFTIAEGSTTRKVTANREYYSAGGLAVKSVGDHWAVGFESQAVRASFENIDLSVDGGPAVEYSLWPYSEATRRSLVFRYSAGVRSLQYAARTIYNQTSETLPAHVFKSEMKLKQRWGSLNMEAQYFQYLHDTQFYNLYTRASANLRLFKGFSVNFYGSYSRVRDQLSLSQEELTPEEVLLRQQQLATGFRYYGGVGVSYSFGSIFNNVVNPRFD